MCVIDCVRTRALMSVCVFGLVSSASCSGEGDTLVRASLFVCFRLVWMDGFKTEQLRVREREKEGGKWVEKREWGKRREGERERKRVQASEQAILAFLFWAALHTETHVSFFWSLHPLLLSSLTVTLTSCVATPGSSTSPKIHLS